MECVEWLASASLLDAIPTPMPELLDHE